MQRASVKAKSGGSGQRACALTLESELAPEELAAMLTVMRSMPAGKCLEVGTAAGGTLCAMMTAFDGDSRPGFVVVDPMTYFPDQLAVVRRNLEAHGLDPRQVDLRVTTSAAALDAARATNEAFAFMLIDGVHKIRYVVQDISWTHLLVPGGVVCFHDYNDAHPGVMLAVNRFLAKHRNYRREALTGALLVVRKMECSLSPEVTRLDRAWAFVLAPALQLRGSLRKRGWT
jgi:predicted O-methyltransferase YrrM